ncbi:MULTISPECIES: FtsW/RodA/SpoVE family cell cycle protein [unclassified Helicobacter]|uniref:FtsW/RodA/SpoVE family cell cycle protein n=1 Tax=unclassified Helicobacter TaxID=2593540 RepID=UPI000CF024A9|nr:MULTISPECIES: FtsW/RodA/SpoVE family cell cycle protein [unclassified Helicobacter]
MADTKLFIYTTILITVGTIMSYSLSTYPTILYHYSPMHFFSREFVIALIGIFLMWGISYFDMDKVLGKIGIIFLAIFSTLIVFFIFLPESIAPTISGARRWIKLPFFPIAIAPIEFFKIGFIWFLSWSLTRKYQSKTSVSMRFLEEFSKILPYGFLLALVFVFVAIFQNDLGQTVLLGIVMAGMILLSGGSFRVISSMTLLAIIGIAMSVVYKPHRLNRIKTWWSGVQDPILAILPKNVANFIKTENLPEPYQILNATQAIQNGGITGQGIGQGTIKLGFLSDVHTDMVLAGIAEEAGLIGLGFCFLLFFVIVFRIFKIANRMEQMPHFLFCMGTGLMISFSLLINAWGIASIIPLKGIAVPFLTYGGSSLLANCIAIGLVLALSKKAKNLY